MITALASMIVFFKNSKKKSLLFFSSGYDHVLLQSYLVPYLFEGKFRPKLEKRGNKVTSISTHVGIVFRDVTKLLAPSTNLRSFGRLFNLEQAKAHFPFGILNSVDVLSVPLLPTESKYWTSDLCGEPVSESQIAEAVRLFESAKCKNIGDYLRTYLKLDVDILYLATQEWRRHLKSVVDLDFVECKKFTISSLSYLAGAKTCVRSQKLGHFFPNNSQTYRLLRLGMRG